MNQPLLSVLICSITERAEMLSKLKKSLAEQRQAAGATDDVEIIAYVDDKRISIGTKRNRLVMNARGEYVCFVDDDDRVPRTYVSKILAAIRNGKPDCVGIEGRTMRHGKRWITFRHSIQYRSYKYDRQGRVITRFPNHLNPIRRDIVARNIPKEMPFPKKDLGEDSDFSRKLLDANALITETWIDGPVYFCVPSGSWKGKAKAE